MTFYDLPIDRYDHEIVSAPYKKPARATPPPASIRMVLHFTDAAEDLPAKFSQEYSHLPDAAKVRVLEGALDHLNRAVAFEAQRAATVVRLLTEWNDEFPNPNIECQERQESNLRYLATEIYDLHKAVPRNLSAALYTATSNVVLRDTL